MKIIDISIRKQLILWPADKRVIAESVGVVKFSCTFDGDWDGLTKKVVFTNGNTIKEVLLTSDEPQLIPHEVLTAGKLYVSVVGLADDGSIKLTTRKMPLPVTILESGDQTSRNPAAYTPELWEQVLATIGNLSQLKTETKNNVVAAINEIFATGGSGGTVGTDGGYYAISVSQPDSNTIKVEFTPSKDGMPEIEPVEIELPKGEKGDTGTSVAVESVSESDADGGNNVVTFTDGKTLTVRNGTQGSPGKNGTSVTVKSVTESAEDGGSNVVEFTDGETVTIKNGSKGNKGDTPVRSTDYWTAADIAEIKSYVDNAILGGAW